MYIYPASLTIPRIKKGITWSATGSRQIILLYTTWSNKTKGLGTTVDYSISRGLEVREWNVEDCTFSASDHHLITFNITVTNSEAVDLSSLKHHIFETDTEGFLKAIKTLPPLPPLDSPTNIDSCFSSINSWLKDAVINNTKIKQLNAKTVWWTPKIEDMKCALKKLNRMKYPTYQE